MAKNNKVIIIIAVIFLVAVVILSGHLAGNFSILPSGQYNSYGNCTFTTNIAPVNSSFADYIGTSAWIAIDYDGTGKHVFGYGGPISSTQKLYGCGGTGAPANWTSKLLVSNYNSNGDDIYYFVGYQGLKVIYICSSDGMTASYFDNQNVTGAITTCDIPCVSNWSVSSWSICTNSTQTRTVTDLNSCAIPTNKPIITQSCTLPTTLQDVINFAQQWISGTKSFIDLLNFAKTWVGA